MRTQCKEKQNPKARENADDQFANRLRFALIVREGA